MRQYTPGPEDATDVKKNYHMLQTTHAPISPNAITPISVLVEWQVATAGLQPFFATSFPFASAVASKAKTSRAITLSHSCRIIKPKSVEYTASMSVGVGFGLAPARAGLRPDELLGRALGLFQIPGPSFRSLRAQLSLSISDCLQRSIKKSAVYKTERRSPR